MMAISKINIYIYIVMFLLICGVLNANSNDTTTYKQNIQTQQKENITIISENKKVYAIFNTQANRSSNMGFMRSGVVDKVHTSISKKVKKGDILISLINNDAKSNIDIAKAKYELSKKDYDRFRKIKNVIDEVQLNKYKYTYLQNKANLALSYANFNKTLIIAPYDGIISNMNFQKGDIVSAFSEVLIIKQERYVKLILEFDEKYYSIIKVGDKFEYKVDDYNQDKNKHSNIGIINKIYPSIDITTRKIKAEVLAKDLPDGLFGDGYIITQTIKTKY